MNRGLKMKRIGELVDIFNHIRVPLSSNERENLEKIYPYYGAQNIVDYVDKYLFDGEFILVAEDGENLRSNNQNICNLVKGKFWVNNHAHILKANDENCNKYLYYNFNRIYFSPFITGSAQPKLNKENLLNIITYVHEFPEQQKIASVLSALDSKIELNNRINAELEAMAKTLYDYWFVQFEFPIEAAIAAKMGDPNLIGKPYKTSGGKMVWNDELKREIPEGWEVKELHKIAKCLMGQSPKGESYNQDGIGTPLLNGPADYENGALKGRTYTTEPTRLCQKDDLVLCIRATIGNLVYSEQEFCLGRGVAAVRANDKRLSELIYFLLIQEIERFKVQATGSIIVGITKDDLIESKCLIPKDDLIIIFHNLIKPQFEKIRINLKENQKLTELRDWLLPMLMNGQVKVK